MLMKLFGNDQADLVRAIAENSDDAIYAKDTEGRFRFANPAALAVLGRPLEHVLGRTNEELQADRQFARRIMEHDREVLGSGRAIEVEETVPMPDGTLRCWSSRRTPLRDAQGAVIGLLGISRDITERKKHDAEREALARQWQLALDAARMGWWHYDLATATLTYDPRVGRVFGFRGGNVDGEEIMRLVKPEDVASVQEAIRDAVETRPRGSFAVQFRIVRHDGAELWIEAHGMALPAQGEARAGSLIGTVADISTRKATEQALRESNAQLQDANTHKDEFIATLAHELRNPLAPLKNIVELLKARDDDPLVHRLRPVMDRQISHLARLVDDLLDVSRITRGVIHLQEQVLDLSAVALASAEPFRGAMEAARVQFETSVGTPGPRVLGDETRLAQCVTNLLSNALKFTPADGTITLVVRQEGAVAALEVRDTGTGVAPESLEKIFQLFVQDQPGGLRGTAGLGIGLALTRKLVELHGGTIRAYSRGLGLGSKFRIELPLTAESAITAQPPVSGSTQAGCGLSVLVVDDNADAADSLREMLAMAGYRARAAYTGQAALDAIATEQPDVALLDIGLPDIDGYEVCRRIRARSQDHQPALIAVTGWGQERDKERATAAGFNGHLTKPADPAELLSMLRQLGRAARMANDALARR